MAIVSCPKCGHSVSSEALKCPNCSLNLQANPSSHVSLQPAATVQQQLNYVNNSVPSVGEWMLYLFVVAIPLVGLILLIVWAFDKDNLSRKNWASAVLLWYVIIFFIVILFWTAAFSAIVGAFR